MREVPGSNPGSAQIFAQTGNQYLLEVEYGGDAVGHVEHSSRVTAHDEEESVGRLEDQMLQLLIGEEGGFVRRVVLNRTTIVTR